jgi:hypothetical protein
VFSQLSVLPYRIASVNTEAFIEYGLHDTSTFTPRLARVGAFLC